MKSYTEEEEMEAFVDKQGCPSCEGRMKYTGTAQYTGPLQWAFKCVSCEDVWMVGYSDFTKSEISFIFRHSWIQKL